MNSFNLALILGLKIGNEPQKPRVLGLKLKKNNLGRKPAQDAYLKNF